MEISKRLPKWFPYCWAATSTIFNVIGFAGLGEDLQGWHNFLSNIAAKMNSNFAQSSTIMLIVGLAMWGWFIPWGRFLAWVKSHQKPKAIDYRIDRRDKVVLECADRLKKGETFMQALQGAKADEMERNDDLCYVCETLARHGHESPFGESGAFCGIAKGRELDILRDLRLRGVGGSEIDIYEYVLKRFLAETSPSLISSSVAADPKAWKHQTHVSTPPQP